MAQTWETDVLVVGGGPAGIGAALGAARKGVRTLLIENHGFLGGIASFCLGMPINQMRPSSQPRSDVHELVIEKLLTYGDLAVKIGEHQLWCNVEYLKVAVLDALDAVGCRYVVHTRAVDAVVEGNRVAGVVVGTKRGLVTIRAKAVVDCTGDADVAFFAGAETLTAAYVLTEEDAKNGQAFDDAIAWRSGFLDIGFTRYEKMKVHDVPYRSILPEKLDGLLMAGRCISASHVAASAGKSMGNCMATGHAAGLAAVMSVRKGCMPRELKVGDLQDTLCGDGVDLARSGVEQDIWR